MGYPNGSLSVIQERPAPRYIFHPPPTFPKALSFGHPSWG